MKQNYNKADAFDILHPDAWKAQNKESNAIGNKQTDPSGDKVPTDIAGRFLENELFSMKDEHLLEDLNIPLY